MMTAMKMVAMGLAVLVVPGGSLLVLAFFAPKALRLLRRPVPVHVAVPALPPHA